MNWLALIAISIGSFVAASQPRDSEAKGPATEPICCFTAQVKWIDTVGKWQGKAVPIGTELEQNWLAGIDILSIEKPSKVFDTTGQQVLMMHSPVRFFAAAADEVVGQRYSFRVFGEVKGGVPRFLCAELKEQEQLRTK